VSDPRPEREESGEGASPFELEPTAPAPARPAPPRAPEPAAAEPAYEHRLLERAAEHAGEVDERTVAERLGRDVPRGGGPVAAPPEWPREAFQFPLRRPGPAFLLTASVLFLLTDAVALVPQVAFLGWLMRLFVFVWCLRALVLVAGQGAAGHDEPRGWADAAQVDREEGLSLLWVLGLGAAALLPGLVFLFLDRTTLALLLLAVGLLPWAPLLLGWALRDSRLRRPWTALGWAWRHPRPLLATGGLLCVLVLLETAIAALGSQAAVLVLATAAVLRVTCAYVWLLVARVLGVAGRSWTPEG